MKDPLLMVVRKFLETRVVPQRPVLLGYSGGPDSKALLYLLLECRRFFPFEMVLAHVDHGWRAESRAEALILQKEAENLNIPFYLKTCSKEDFSIGNLEEQGRVLRLRFFSKLYTDLECQALALGHHADDQAEVVLKRVFEGASLFALGGLSEERVVSGMNIWRPLLSIPKKAVLDWLARRNLTFFVDPTNFSFQNLRGKMRQEILPALSQAFGKEISDNLYWLGEESQQLKEYFSVLNQPILSVVQKKATGFSLDISPFMPLPAMQLKYLLKECLSREGIMPSRQILTDLVGSLLDRSIGKRFITGQGEYLIERGSLSFNWN